MDGKVWVANQDAGTVSAIDANTGAVQTFTVGHQVTNIAAGGGQVLIAVDKSPEDVISALPGKIMTVAMNTDVLQITSPDPATNPYPYNRMLITIPIAAGDDASFAPVLIWMSPKDSLLILMPFDGQFC